MATAGLTIPTTQSALLWVRVSADNPFEWTTSAPVVQPSQLCDNEVLIQNYAVALNPVDYKLAGYNFLNIKLPSTVGFDVSGRVVAVGKGVTNVKVGDDVFGILSSGSGNISGGLQQYSVASANGLIKKPADISHEQAATLSIAFLTAMV